MSSEKTTCRLCGGYGYVSQETAAMGGRSHGDTRCPSCDGEGRCVSRPCRITVNDRLAALIGARPGVGGPVLLVRNGRHGKFYVSLRYLWASDRERAFPLPSRATALKLMAEFPDVLAGCVPEPA